jgi:hypothetical protein
MSEDRVTYDLGPTHPALCRLYLGLSTDDGGEIAPDAVFDWLSTRCEAFTVQEARGFQRGRAEASLVITLGNKRRRFAEQVATELCAEFRQRAVGVEFDGEYRRMETGHCFFRDLLVPCRESEDE